MTAVPGTAEKVRRIVAAMAPEPPAELDDAQRLIEDLGFDSLRLMELTVVLERSFDLPRYRPEELIGVRRVGEVISLVTGTLSATDGGPSNATPAASQPLATTEVRA
ncbi:acyl carrier protein [Nocardia sp. NPDC050710]|uniref:acyl carrier protein n=1 Tax=Nocardia sp. NPDC050710 TaxID=3157220 RepID=UPI00340AFEB2